MHTRLLNLITLSFFTALLTLSFSTSSVFAQTPSGYGSEFGLFVDSKNKNLGVPIGKGEQVLQSFFEGVPLKAVQTTEYKGFMSQKDFLLSFEKLRLEHEEEGVQGSDEELYRLAWLKARRLGWLPNTQLTFESVQDFFYRYSVSKKHDGVAYYEGLVLEEGDISINNFNSIGQVRNINERLENHVTYLENLEKPTREQAGLLANLNSYSESFVAVERELEEMEHPLNKISNLPEDIRQKIIDNDLNEILGQIEYDYSKNKAYRKHNLVTGISNLSGRVYRPGEEMDFYDVLSANGWGVYRSGYAIIGGKEQLILGGGVCGSASLAFGPSWLSGLDITKRHSHSIYYQGLYPEIGLDATIFGRQKNLKVKNNTNSPILYYIQNNPEEQTITVFVIGNSPYKNIEIEGPIKINWNTYKWVRKMEKFDGTVVVDELVSRYGAIR